MKTQAVRELILALAIFFNPFGYNEIFALTMKLTGSYWRAAFCFYGISGILFLIYIILKRKGKRNGLLE